MDDLVHGDSAACASPAVGEGLLGSLREGVSEIEPETEGLDNHPPHRSGEETRGTRRGMARMHADSAVIADEMLAVLIGGSATGCTTEPAEHRCSLSHVEGL